MELKLCGCTLRRCCDSASLQKLAWGSSFTILHVALGRQVLKYAANRAYATWIVKGPGLPSPRGYKFVASGQLMSSEAGGLDTLGSIGWASGTVLGAASIDRLKEALLWTQTPVPSSCLEGIVFDCPVENM